MFVVLFAMSDLGPLCVWRCLLHLTLVHCVFVAVFAMSDPGPLCACVPLFSWSTVFVMVFAMSDPGPLCVRLWLRQLPW